MTELTSTAHCKECGGRCCTQYPHILEKEMHRIKERVGDNIEMSFAPVPGLKGWYTFTTSCPLFNPEEGCCLEPEDRPLVCQILVTHPGLLIQFVQSNSTLIDELVERILFKD